MKNFHGIRWVQKLTPVQLLLIFYLIAIFAATIALCLPFAHQETSDIPFIDILFTAVSAVSVTGLSTITIAETLSIPGVIILALIMQVGAVGVMAVATMIWEFIGKKIRLTDRQLIMRDQNQHNIKGMVRFIKDIIYAVLLIELIGTIILGTHFLQYFPTAGEAYFQGLFAAVSAVTNGGYDITGNSLIPFQDDYFVQIVTVLLIILGAIGYPVLSEVKNYLLTKREQKKWFHFSLFTKVTTITFFLLIFIGACGIYILDMTNAFSGRSWHESFFNSLFLSVTTRSGGLTTMDLSQLTEANQLFMSLLMFIGASPNSAGGGIRTTTFALVLIFIITFARGGKSIRIFNREIYTEDLLKAVTVTLVALILVFASVLVMSIAEPFSLVQVLFEVTSAFGTVGLSLGITSELSIFSKCVLMCLMFIGRVGVLTFLFMFNKKREEAVYHYPKEHMQIG